jgi:phosphatidylglycerophosphatase A
MKTQSFKNIIILFFAQGAYSGKFPIAPGTAGTAVGVLLYFLIKDISPLYYLFICIVVYGIGTWTSGEAEKLLGKKDASSIVIDEIAGFFVSMFMVPFGWGFVIAGFFLFRFFDILKPWPLNKLQNLRGGTGVMLDDIGAGIYVNAILQVSSYFIGGR